MKTKTTLLLLLIVVINTTSLYSQVVINEVMAYPSGNQGIIQFNGNSGNEYVELYNPTCSAIDVSGYFIGSRQDFAGTMSGGAFRIPNIAAAIIPPNGHLVIGTSTASADANSVDIKTTIYTTNYCQNSTSNFILANADGWVGLYNAAGVPVDAIYWSSSAGNISNSGDYTGTPCVTTGSPAGVSLESAQQINSGFPGVLNYVGNTTSVGQTFSRVPDGGAWVRNIASSINNLTVGNCNGGNCVTAASFAITSSIVQPSCGNPNGSITITPTTTGTYTYTWTPNVSITNSATALAAGAYSIHIDKNGCTKDTTITLINSSFPTAILSTPTNPNCGLSDGQIVLGAVTGGVSPYQYNFNGLGFSTTTSYPNLAAGSYSLIVKDANGCTFTATNIVLSSANGPTAIVTTTTNPSCGGNDGQVVLGAVTGGSGPYQYNFNGLGLSSTTTYTNLSASTYTLIVEDNNGCSYTAPSIIITSANGPTSIVVTKTNTSCGTSDGQVLLGAVTGGTAPFQYNFNGLGLSSTSIYTLLSASTYTLTIQDNNGCTFTAPNIVLTAGNGPSAIITTKINETCTLSNGQISLGNVTGGSSPYLYNFNGLGLTANIIYTNLAAGTYTLIVQDNNGCSYTATSIILTNTPGPTTVNPTSTNEACSLSNGQVTIGAVTGGAVPYQYNFNGLGYSSTTSYPNLSEGTYTLSVRDLNGCILTASSIVLTNTSGPTSVIVTATSSTCNLNNGSVLIGSVTGGLAPYQYDFNEIGYSLTTSFSNLSASSYTLSVQDGNGCILDAPAVIVGNISGPNDLTLISIDASCEKNNGEINITNTNGGTAPYTYSIDGTSFSTIVSFTNLVTGTYSLTVKDANGCSYSESKFIINNPSPIANFNFDPGVIKNEKEDISLTDESTGNIVSYVWFVPDGVPTGDTTKNFATKFKNFEEGFYPMTLIITNEFGCIDSITKYIERRIDPIIYIPNTFTPDGDTHNNSWEYSLIGLDLSFFNMRVFNRWGTVVWESNDQNASWDGKFKGEMVQSGTYTWTMIAKDNIEDKHLYLNGNLNVLY